MATVPVYVGLDYHHASVQICILDPEGKVLANRPCPNDADAIAELVRPFSDDAGPPSKRVAAPPISPRS
jgi:hypothetical protein